ncbi:MAG: hypothetical protein LBM74_05445 [Oscillospiraceae bacterium]|nr:hypothetical protein [Oscillospiraceae bacterium]
MRLRFPVNTMGCGLPGDAIAEPWSLEWRVVLADGYCAVWFPGRWECRLLLSMNPVGHGQSGDGIASPK